VNGNRHQRGMRSTLMSRTIRKPLQYGRMDHEEVGRYWDGNAEVWTELVRAGYDHYRDGPNSPAFFEMLPDVEVCPVSMSATT
jgi:hypothetical protein